MDSGSSCLCDSSDTTDPTEYLEALKQKYLARTAKLQSQQQALERKIMTMETFIDQPVPKVFPDEAPVRDTPNIPKIISDQQPMTQQCSFFQKMMENARSILSMKCQCPSATAKSTSVTPTAPTTTSSEPPTRDNDHSTQENVVDYDLTDKSSRTSTCTCEFTDPSTLQDFSCTCNITDSKPKSQQVSNELSSSTPKSQQPENKNKSSDLISGDCSCEVCQCDSMLTVDELEPLVPTVSVFQDNVFGGTQTMVGVDDKSLQATKDTVSKCVTCCRNSSCPNKPKSSAVGESVVSASVQVASHTKNKAVNIQPASTVCKAQCNTDLGQDKVTQGVVTAKDNQNQCAFVGSPLLDFPQGGSRTKLSSKKSCTTSGFSLTSNDILEMQNIAELAKKEKQMKAQIKELQKREKQYQEASKNVETLTTKCCDCGNSGGISAEIDKISRELRLENKVLKSELEGLKLELKHCLEKVEGPMKQQLQTEKMKCENLQKDLQSASKNMVISQDAYSREMNQLKMQLCCACTNITELNQMNQRLKDEMSQLDCLCQKLEDDLMKQKINEAETIKRLTNRKFTPESQVESFKCDSNLDVIARKLSKTLKDLGPCEECSKLPAELAGAARCIKELTDMVRKRRTRSSSVSGCCCQGPPAQKLPPEDDGECCTCCGPREGAGEPVKTILDVPKSFVQNDESSKFDVPGGQSSYFSAKGEAPCAGFGTPCVQGKSQPVQVPSKLDQSCSCSDPEGKPIQVPEDAGFATQVKSESATPTPMDSLDVTPSQDASFVTSGGPDSVSGKLTSSPITESGQEPPPTVELPPDQPQEGLIEIPVEEKRFGGDFPYEVETKGYALPEPPTDLHVTTAVTGSGTLEVITEGPEGVIATRLTYTEEGNIEVVTEMTEGEAVEEPGMEKFATQPVPGVPYVASSVTFAEEPDREKLQFMPVASSNISGLSGPQAESPYTESSATAVGGELTSKLGSDSSGLKPEQERSAELTSGFGDATRAELGPGVLEQPSLEATETTKEQDIEEAIRDGLPSEGATSTAGELKSGDVFTPDQVASDYEEGVVAVKSLEGSTKSTDLELDGKTEDVTDLVKEEPEMEIKVEAPEDVGEAAQVKEAEAIVEQEQPQDVTLPEEAVEIKVEVKEEEAEHPSEVTEPTLSEEKIGEEVEIPAVEAAAPEEIEETRSSEEKIREVPPVEVSATEEIEEIKSFGEPPTEKLDEESAPTTLPTEEGDQPPGDETPGVGALVTRDCSCQSRDKTDQSCQCCECKTVGVTTSGDKETITETVAMGQSPEEPLDGTKTDTDSEFITISEATTDNAQAEEPDSTKPDDTTVLSSETTTKPTEDLVEAEPPAEPVDQEVLMQVDYTTPKPSSMVEQPFEVNEELLGKHPELQGKTPSEQQKMLKQLGYISEEAPGATEVQDVPEEAAITVRESILQKHPELQGKRLSEQQRILQSLAVQEIQAQSLVQKHPELQGKTSSEQKRILQSLGYSADEIREGLAPKTQKIRDSLVQKHPELQGKTSSQQKRILKELGYKDDQITPELLQQTSGVTLELLQKHPELQGKTPSQQKAILKQLGYEGEQVTLDLLSKHPELQGKTPSEQKKLLQELGYPDDAIQQVVSVSEQKPPSEHLEHSETLVQVSEIPSKPTQILINQDLLDKHPELVGKSSEEQQKILRDLGYVAPAEIQEVLKSHPELAGLSLEEQKSKLEAMGYILDAVLDSVISKGEIETFQSALMQQSSEAISEAFTTPQPSSRDVSITCKAPCRTAAVPSEPKVSKRVSSREVSVTCKASCRSAATLSHSVTPKDSKKEVVAVGDVSVTSLSKSRSVSLQQRPSSRDDSASCKASCRTISVQSSTTKPPKPVESNSTSSSSSEKYKKRSGEVPPIVYELSDKERPVVETPRKFRTTKKRRIRVIDCLKCYCNDPCNCVVCTPERNRRPLNQSVRSCHCPPHITQRPVQTSFSMPPTGHAPNCKCDACLCIPPSNLESPTTDDADHQGKKLKHPSSCECVDCLCLPKVKKLARTKEYPIVYEKKQVYQVKVKCDSCVNAQNARRYVEQTRSRIPISTTTPNPPRPRPEPNEAAAPPSATQSDYHSIVCDCQKCICSDCPDESKKKPGAKNDKGCCCKASVCTCDPCAIDELAKRLKEAEQKLSAAPGPTASTAPPAPSGAPAAPDATHDEPCNCPVCLCPGKDQIAEGAPPAAGPPPADGAPPSAPTDTPAVPPAAPSGGDGSHPPDCDCTQCVCPGLEDYKAGKSKAPKQDTGGPSGAGGDEDCNCDVCACPGSKTPGAAGAAVPPVAPICDCNVCKCSPCGDPAKQTSAPPGGGVADCDCVDCKCNPCADPKKRKSCPTDGAGAAHPDGCDCPECSCPGTKDKTSGLTDKLSKFTDMPEKVPHPPDCDCSECMCLEEIIQTELVGQKEQGVQPAVEKEVHASGCACPECLCPECTMKSVHAMGCKCGTCVCSPCDKEPGQAGDQAKKAGDHPEGCTCIKCMCDVCPTMGKTSDGASPAAKSAGGEPHGDNCKCVECLCKECFMKLAPLKHEEGCQCPQCVCVECLKKMQQGDFQVSAKQVLGGKPEESKRGPNCTCEHCICIDCGGKGTATSTGTQPSGKDGSCSCAPCECKPCFSKAQPEEECTCPECTCVICTKKRKEGAVVAKSTEPLKEEKSTHAKGCTCKVCTCEGPAEKAEKGKGEGQSMEPPPFEPYKRIDCNCTNCKCIICAPHAGGPLQGSSVPDYVPPPFEVPVRIECICKRCSCIFCNKDAPPQRSVAAQPSVCATNKGADLKKAVSVQQPSQSHDPPTATKSTAGHPANCACPDCTCKPCPLGGASANAVHCNCPTCQCKPCKFPADSFMSAKGSAKPPDVLVHCNCPTCTCGEGVIKTTALDKSGAPSKIAQKSTTGEVYQSAETLVLPKPDVRQMFPDHPAGCNCVKCVCDPCPDPQMKNLDNVALVKSIQAANKENCECREQIEEIKKTLEKIRCACTEAEFRSTQSMGQSMGKDMSPLAGKPFVKQASAFGQTMSGLKMALNNLQAKCTAKDRMIEAMTTELTVRGTPDVFDKVLDVSVKIPKPLDYDQAEDIKSEEFKLTHVLYPPVETKDRATAANDLKNVASKCVEVRTHKHKKKKKTEDCECENPPITQRQEKDCQKIDLAGFEVIDIRRITDDSLIVKWNCPANELIQGYDIYVNGTLSTKVMSGTRTSAMIHSLDLSKSVQITIYATTKCGRVEPPAIAIYEIKANQCGCK